jgi:hypothetical protein
MSHARTPWETKCAVAAQFEKERAQATPELPPRTGGPRSRRLARFLLRESMARLPETDAAFDTETNLRGSMIGAFERDDIRRQ